MAGKTRGSGVGSRSISDGSIENRLHQYTTDDIARRAHELFEQRGGAHGHDLDDWLQAEVEIRRIVGVPPRATHAWRSHGAERR